MELLQYLFLSTICLSLSYIIFRLFFRDETGFQNQRFFIVASALLSLLLPLTGLRLALPSFTGDVTILPSGISLTGSPEGATPASTREAGFPAGNPVLLVRLYILMVSVFILAASGQVVRILRLSGISAKTRRGRITILTHPGIRSPFSFFNLVFIPGNITDGEEKENILIHESIHVSQCHSLDNLLIELTAALMWFNPFAWMMRNSLHLVHEYLADEGTLGAGIDRTRYQALLINQAAEERLISLSSGFNRTLIKKRMIMMTKSKNNQRGRLKILALLPLTLILILTVALLNGIFLEETKAGSFSGFPVVKQVPLSAGGNNLLQDTIIDKKIKVRVDAGGKVSKVKEFPQDTVIIRKIKEPAEGKKSIVKNVKVIGYGDKDSSGTIIYVIDGDNVKVIKDVEDDFEVVEVNEVEELNELEEVNEAEEDVMTDKIKEVEIEGENVVISEINTDDIESVNVHKDDNLIVIRTRKNSDRQASKDGSKIRLRGVDGNVIYVIDGKTADRVSLESVDPNEIESIAVIKDEHAEIRKYTDRDVDGVIVITTKKNDRK